MTLDLSLYRHMSRIDRRDLHEIHERLKEMRDEIKKWTASGRGLLRLSPEDVKARDEAWVRAVQERAEERQAESNARDEDRESQSDSPSGA